MTDVYLDNAATTAVATDVAAAMQPFLGPEFGNPSSRHPIGVRAAEAVDRARSQVARALGARPGQVVFTAGGTEANNLAVTGVARAQRRNGRHVLVGPTEHPCVRNPARALEEEGFDVEDLRLAEDGSLDLEDLERKLRPETVLVAQMLASNELGSVYPVAQVARRVKALAPRAKVAVDAVQAFGKLDCALDELGVDCVSISSHKIHGPKGAGAVVLAEDCEVRPLIHGGGQERGRRAGTENVPGIVGFGAAAAQAEDAREETHAALAELRALFVRRVLGLPGVRILEPGADALAPLPSIVAILLPGVPAEVRMHHLEARGVMVSAGSACRAGNDQASPAMLAAGLTAEEARHVLRISFSRFTTEEEVDRALATLTEVTAELDVAAR